MKKPNPRKLKKKRERAQRKRRDSRRQRDSRVRAEADPLRNSPSWPVLGAWLTRGWKESGYAVAVISRTRSAGVLACVFVHVDLWGRGVTLVDIQPDLSEAELRSYLRQDEDRGLPAEPCLPGLALAVVETGARLATAHVGKVPFDFPGTQPFWEGIDSAPFHDEVPIGRGGQIVLRLDLEEDAEDLLCRFDAALGPDNYEFEEVDEVTREPLRDGRELGSALHEAPPADRLGRLAFAGRVKADVVALLVDAAERDGEEFEWEEKSLHPNSVAEIDAWIHEDPAMLDDLARGLELHPWVRALITGWKESHVGEAVVLGRQGSAVRIRFLADGNEFDVEQTIEPGKPLPVAAGSLILTRIDRFEDGWTFSGNVTVISSP